MVNQLISNNDTRSLTHRDNMRAIIMTKSGENIPHIIDNAVDFMASSQAFREYLRKLPPDDTIPPDLTDEHVPLYIGGQFGDRKLLYGKPVF